MTNPNDRPKDPFHEYSATAVERERQLIAYKEWYASLLEGDEVYYDVGRVGYYHTKRTQVVKRTATGMIRTEDGQLFDSRGLLRGSGYRSVKLYPYRTEHAAYDARRKMLAEIDRIDWKTVSDEGLRKLAELSVEYLLPEYSKQVPANE